MRENQPRVFRISISDQYQIHLPELLVQQIGSESRESNKIQGAFTVWYYHTKQEKVVLASDSVQRDSLERINSVPLQGISNKDLANSDVTGARVTMNDKVRKELGERAPSLNNDDSAEVVLRPTYATNHSGLDATCVSVYPADLYDKGELPNVEQETTPDSESVKESTSRQTPIRTTSSFIDSI